MSGMKTSIRNFFSFMYYRSICLTCTKQQLKNVIQLHLILRFQQGSPPQVAPGYRCQAQISRFRQILSAILLHTYPLKHSDLLNLCSQMYRKYSPDCHLKIVLSKRGSHLNKKPESSVRTKQPANSFFSGYW